MAVTITNMTACSVLRCPETPTAAFSLILGSRLEAPVCRGHLSALEHGARWMLHGGAGVQAESGTQQSGDLRILMGEDLPHDHLMGFGVSQTIGDVPGFTVELDIETPEGRQQVSFWTTADIGNRLGSFLTSPLPKP